MLPNGQPNVRRVPPPPLIDRPVNTLKDNPSLLSGDSTTETVEMRYQEFISFCLSSVCSIFQFNCESIDTTRQYHQNETNRQRL